MVRGLLVSSLVSFVWMPAITSAQVTNTRDGSAAVVTTTPPTPLSLGVGNGFGGMIGNGLTIAVDTALSGRINLRSGGGGTCFGASDVAVVYIDSIAGGIADTTGLTDTADLFRRAVSATDGSNSSDLTFAAGFEPDYALAFQISDGAFPPALFELTAGSLTFVVNATPTELPSDVGGVCSAAAIEIDLSSLGLAPGDSFSYVVTLLNGDNAFRSNELHGVATAPGSNVGQNPFTFPAGSFNDFQTVGGPLLINEVDVDQVGTDETEYIELLGPANLDLTGYSIVLFNGADDASYDAFSLAGQSLDAGGRFVAGSLLVSDVDLVIGVSNVLQNGADGIAVVEAVTTAFPNDTPVSVVSTVFVADAVVYGTSDADDAELLAALTPGEAQIDEGTAGTESFGRCPDGGGAPRQSDAYRLGAPTSGLENDCPLCGNGAMDAGEACDDGATNGATPCGCQLDCSFGAAGTTCGGAPTGSCDQQNICDGSGACVDLVEPATTECRAAASSCDVAERCDGTSHACPVDAFAADGTDCGDGTACNGAETCVAGACSAGAAVDCDDGDGCTADMCVEPGGTCTNTQMAGCVDGGAADRDAGTVAPDAGTIGGDAGTMGGDGGRRDGGAPPPPTRDDGCSCHAAGAGDAPTAAAIGVVAVVLFRRRRRRRR